MAETGIVRFPGSLDPSAEEFRPRNPSSSSQNQQVALYTNPPPPPLYYPYASPYPPISEVQVLPFCDGGGLGYHHHHHPHPQFSSPAAYVSPATVTGRQRQPVAPPAASAVATRALLLSCVPSDASESGIRNELEAFGEVRGVQLETLCDGIVTVHFYDLRHAETALREIRHQHMQQQQQRTWLRSGHHYNELPIQNSRPDERNSPPPPPEARGLIAGQPVWAQFVIPAANAVPDGHNQGTIVIFNLDSEVTASLLKDMFQAFGTNPINTNYYLV